MVVGTSTNMEEIVGRLDAEKYYTVLDMLTRYNEDANRHKNANHEDFVKGFLHGVAYITDYVYRQLKEIELDHAKVQ